ncbi:hypothetical protein GCM10023324_64670 [Streptomyces youssoufiensis]
MRPDGLGELFRRHRMARREEQGGEDGSLPGRAEVYRTVVNTYSDRTKDVEMHWIIHGRKDPRM